jgi:hypothetical protein
MNIEVEYREVTDRADFFLNGKVPDAKKRIPVPYVNVYLQFARQGTSCNESGEFNIHLDRSHFSDTLIFSAIGYNTYQVAANGLPVSEITVLLEEATIDLNEVAIAALSPVDIIRKAMRNRAENYGTAPRLAVTAVDIYDVPDRREDVLNQTAGVFAFVFRNIP